MYKRQALNGANAAEPGNALDSEECESAASDSHIASLMLNAGMQGGIAGQDIGADISDAEPLLPLNGLDLKEYLSNLEKSLIEQALHDCDGVVARAADRLSIRRTTLVEKMRKYDMQRA